MFGFWSSSPIFFGKHKNQGAKSSYFFVEIGHPPPHSSLEKVQTQAEKFFKNWILVRPPPASKISNHKQQQKVHQHFWIQTGPSPPSLNIYKQKEIFF